MRVGVAAVSATVLLATAVHAQEGYLYPSCIASTLPEGRSYTRFIPPEMKGAPVPQVRAVVQRGVTWRRGETIKICFLSGEPKARERVMRYAREWLQYANVVFDFEEGGAPRQCKGDGHEDIKIDFRDAQGWWSLPGTLSRKYATSMNFQFWGKDTPKYVNGLPVPEATMRTTILHEFGHALGLMHEHQSPNADCDAEIDWDVAYRMGTTLGWPRERVDRNFRQLVSGEEYNSTSVDRRSIMHYSLPVQLFKRGRQSPCWVGENADLSEQDRNFIATIYPKDKPIVVSSAPSHTATRSIGKPAAGGDDKSALVKEYEALLRKSGVAADKVSQLTAEFRQAIAGK